MNYIKDKFHNTEILKEYNLNFNNRTNILKRNNYLSKEYLNLFLKNLLSNSNYLQYNIVYKISEKVKKKLKLEKSLLELSGPIYVFGDIHGNYTQLVEYLKKIEFFKTDVKILLLGDYIDKGPKCLHTISLLFCMKLLYPNRIYLLRGNHETENVNKYFGFYNECCLKYGVIFGSKLWKHINNTFNYLSIGAIIDNQIFCIHAGLSPNLNNIYDINNIIKGSTIPNSGVLCDLLWSDPKKNQDTNWMPNSRGISYTYNEKILKKFMKKNNIKLVCRGHQYAENGYEFFCNEKLITLTSTRNEMYKENNRCCIMYINKNTECSFVFN